MSENTLAERRSKLSPAKRALLEKWTRGEVIVEHPTIPRRSTDSSLPLSFAQERMWFIDQLIPGSPAYNMCDALRMRTRLDVAVLRQSLNEIVRRHEVLRTTFPSVDGQPLQVIAPIMTLNLPVVDLRACPNVEREALALRLAVEDEQRPFDLTRGPLVRVLLLRLGEEEWIFQVTIQHSVFDGWSTVVFIRELIMLYGTFVTGSPSPLSELPIQYADFALWQREWLKGERLEAQLTHWKKQLGGDLPVLELPTDRMRPAIQDLRGARQPFKLSPSLSNAIETLSQNEGVTVFMSLLATFKALLFRYTGQDDLLVGVPTANRTRAEIEPLLGFFVNTLVLRTSLSGNPTFRELLGRVRDTTLDAYANQDLPFEWLVGELQPERDLSRNPLFQVMFTHQNWPRPELELLADFTDDFVIELLETRTRVALFDFWLGVWEEGNKLEGAVEYSTDLFDAATIARILTHYQTLLESVAADPDQRLSDLPLLTEAEQRQLLMQWNDTQAGYPQGLSLSQLVEARVKQMFDTIAVVFEDQHLSYTELNARANQLAHYLQKLGVGPEVVVAVCMDRSLEMVIGLLGILKAGGAYLPLDPRDPTDRILSMLDDSQTDVLLTQDHVVKKVPFTWLQNLPDVGQDIIVTHPRPQIKELDTLPLPDRNLVDYGKYNQYHAQGLVKRVINIIATRGCPYHCLYCHKIWPKKHVVRSAQNIFEEVKIHYDNGYTTFNFPDDIFNLDRQNSEAFFELVIRNNLKIRMLFPSGLRGDILTPDYIDLMSEAGTILMALALETASPRLQRLIRKNLNIEQLHGNLEYICTKHPHIILELFTMFGFPTETEEEVRMTFDFIKSIRWLHFPYLNALKIFPNTDMARLAIEHGVTKEAIERYSQLAYHQLGNTLPFSQSFARQYQADFTREYFLLPERLENVIPYQKQVLTCEEIIAKYESYLPGRLEDYPEIAHLIGNDVLYSQDVAPEKVETVPSLTKISVKERADDAAPGADSGFRILLIDLSQLFSHEAAGQVFNPVEAPLGLMYLLTYLNQEYRNKIRGKILKSMIDFDNFEELKSLIDDFCPQLIGIRTLSLYKDFFHRAVALIGQWCPDVPIITGGPYATSEYNTILADNNVDLVVLGEGELTLSELVGEILKNNGKLPENGVLERIPGLAFLPRSGATRKNRAGAGRKIVLLDEIVGIIDRENTSNLGCMTHAASQAYVIYTSGSTGQPKGVINTHRGICNRLLWMQDAYQLTQADRILQKTPYNFDVSIWEFFWPLLAGATLVVARPEGHKDTVYLGDLIVDQHISTLHFVPSMLRVFVDEQGLETCNSLKRVICSGEELPFSLQERFHARSRAELYNLYGPTEAAVDVTFWPCQRESERQRVPIGRPIANTQIYLLDQYLNPVPVGVPGELHIGGIGLARGYLNRPELTCEKFIPDPFGGEPGARLYKTGDLARCLPDSDIEFLGRLDHQVKLHGVRVELGEIESVLRQHPALQDAVVSTRDNEHDPHRNQLVAYLIPDSQVQRRAESPAEQVSEWQQVFDRIYDKAGAPRDPTFNIAGWNSSYTGLPLQAEEMREWVDQTAARILSLRPKRVLEIGCGTGLFLFRIAPSCTRYWATDFSTAALRYLEQQLAQLELKLSQVKLFQRTADDLGELQSEAFDVVILNSVIQYFPNIEYLLHVLRVAVQMVTPGGFIFVGDVRSLPLLEAFYTSVELERALPSLTITQLQRRVQRRVNREQELIMDPAFFFAFGQELPQISHVEVYLKRGLYHNELTQFRYDVILHVGGDVQPGGDLPWLDWNKEGLSLDTLCRKLEESAPEILGIHNVPNARLQTEVRTLELLTCTNCPETAGELREALQQDDLVGAVDPEDWWALSDELPYVVNVRWSDSSTDGSYEVLLRRCTTPQTAQSSAVVVRSQGIDGRRPWCEYANNPLQDRFSSRLMPELRRFLKEKLSDYMIPSVFVLMDSWPLAPNGKLDRRALPVPVQAMPEMEEGFVAPRTPIENKLADIWAQVLDLNQVGIYDNFFELGGDSILSIRVVARANKAGIRFTPQHLFQHQTIAELATVAGSVSTTTVEQRPAAELSLLPFSQHSDLPLAGLDPRQIERLLPDHPDAEDIYPLSPMQEYLLLRQLSTPVSGLNIAHQVIYISESQLDVSAFERAWQQVVDLHPALRTSFVWEGLDEPLQIVHKQVAVPVEQYDLRAFSQVEQEQRLGTYVREIRQHGFDVSKVPHMRLALFRMTEDSYGFVWCRPYTLQDGWSYPLILKDFFAFDEAFRRGQEIQLEHPRPFRDYIAWLRQQDSSKAEAFWRKTLRGFTAPTPLTSRTTRDDIGQQDIYAQQSIVLLSETAATTLQALARQQRLTVNAFVQGAFALLLSRWSGCNDVVYGSISSGRPADIEGVENMVGCFNNMLPMRVQIAPETRLLPWLRALQAKQAEVRQYEYSRLVKVKEWSEVSEDCLLFESHLVFENFPYSQSVFKKQSEARWTEVHGFLQTEHPLRAQVWPWPVFHVNMSYYRCYFDDVTIAHLLESFRIIMETFVANPEQRLGELMRTIEFD